jgi:hypothetical protein
MPQQSRRVQQKVRRTFLSVKNPEKRRVFAPSELSESTKMVLSQLVSSASFLSVNNPAKRRVFAASKRSKSTERALSQLLLCAPLNTASSTRKQPMKTAPLAAVHLTRVW